MNIFAISDLHLSAVTPKAMDVFGKKWENHWERISEDWRQRVCAEDVVLIAGDISWAMHLRDAVPDLKAIGELPGRKLLIRGNHDYWHGSLTQTRAALPEGMYFLQNDAVRMGDFVFAGTRGWKQPGETDFSAEDAKIYRRELLRQELTLGAAKKLGGRVIAITHFPPYTAGKKPTPMTQGFSDGGAEKVIFGHIHGDAVLNYSDLTMDGVEYIFTSCDALGFKLKKIETA